MPNDDDILSDLENLAPNRGTKAAADGTADSGNVPSGSAAGSAEGRSAHKVTLDLDDAPFLAEEKPAQENKKEEPKPAAGRPSVQMPPTSPADAAEKQKRRKKLIMIAGAGGLGVLIAVGLLLFFLLRGPSETPLTAPPPPSPVTANATAHNAAAANMAGGNATAPAEPQIGLLAWDPFIIEKKDKDGKIVFLYAKFTASTEDLKLLSEMNAKKVILRDAIFFYLSNKDLQYLSDSSKVDSLKRDLLSVINERLTKGELKEILIENYLVK